MNIKDKVLYLNSIFKKALPEAGDKVDSIFIEGYASTNDVDRSGDVVSASVWEEGIQDYLKNPVILAYHDHDDPAGRMVEHKIDDKGLWIKARISAAAEIFSLVKDGVLTAFSIGFRIVDAEYNAAAEVFIIKKVKLMEISVVSVPCNQNTLFSLSKAFDNATEFQSFKSQFAPKSESAKGLESLPDANSTSQKEVKMTPEEIKQMVADAAKAAAAETTKAFADAATAKAAADATEADVQARIKAAVSAVTPSETGADKLMAEVEKRFADQAATTKTVLEGLHTALNEKAAEIEAMQKSKMSFSDTKATEISYADKEKAVILSRMTGKAIGDTKFGKMLAEKTGAHLPSAVWELEVSLTMENEVRRRLVVAPLLRNIAMQTNVMTIPVNPEAGLATWVTNAQFGTSASPGATQTHALKEITLNAYKVATNEYMAYEEEEDSLIVLMPIVRDAMVRRVARAMDRAFLLGAGSGADPVKGLATYDASSVVAPSVAGPATVADLRAMRKDLGALGLDPAEVTFVVSTDIYYDLLDDTTFQTMDKVGDRATILTGQIGSVGGSPVIVSAEFPTEASGTITGTTNIGAIAFNTSNFIVGNQRGLRMDTQDLVETQRKVFVASLRTGMTQISTSVGQGVSTLRWTV